MYMEKEEFAEETNSLEPIFREVGEIGSKDTPLTIDTSISIEQSVLESLLPISEPCIPSINSLTELDIYIYNNENDIITEQLYTKDMLEEMTHLSDIKENDSLDDEQIDTYFETIYENKNYNNETEEDTIMNVSTSSYNSEYSNGIQKLNEIDTEIHREHNTVPSSSPIIETMEQIPSVIFIIPYRDRENDLDYFLKQMNFILEKVDYKYEMCIIHQTDTRPFNRGAIKNIGFLYVKEKYPSNYKDITLVFNDVDITPNNKQIFTYPTKKGTIKHFYGFRFALGGIVSICAGDFEMIGGYPNFWKWGFEDNMLQKRALDHRLIIDRNQFYEIGNKNVNHVFDSNYRTINRLDMNKYRQKTREGFHSITNISTISKDIESYSIGVDINRNTLASASSSCSSKIIDVIHFDIDHKYESNQDFLYDVRTKLKRQPNVSMTFM